MVVVKHFLLVILLALPGLCGAQKKSVVVVAKAPDTVKPLPAGVPKPVIQMGGQPGAQVVERRGFDLWVLLPIILLIGVGVVVWRRMDAMTEELKSRKRELRSFTDNYAKGSGSGFKAAALDKREVERILADSKVLMELKQAVGKLQQQVVQLEGRKLKTPEPVRGKPVMVAALSPTASDGPAGSGLAAAEVFYMAGPVNNYFPNSAKSLTKDNTVYRFRLSANQQEAEYELHTQGAPIMEIVQLAESYIKAACDEENLPGNPVKNILTKRTGQAILEGDKWVIKRKALIRYE